MLIIFPIYFFINIVLHILEINNFYISYTDLKILILRIIKLYNTNNI